MRIHAGDLRHRIEILRAQKTAKNTFTTVEYLPYKKVWAKANNLYGKERLEAAEYDADRTVVFTIRKVSASDLTVKDRIKFREKIYNITFIDEVLFRGDMVKVTAVAEEEGGGNV